MAGILGRPPLQAGPINNPDGSWNLVWVRWLDALFTLVNMLLDQGVLSLNDLVGALTLLAGDNVSITTSGTDITISSTGGGGGGSGTVTLVSASVPGFLTVSVTNPTTTPSVIITATVEAQNLFLASPNGAGGVMAPRAIVPADLPLGSSTAFGAVKVDGTTITAAAGVISAVGGGGTVTAVTASSPLASTGGATPDISLASAVPLAKGGTAADLSATGGAHQVLKQFTVGGAVTVGQLTASDISGIVSGPSFADSETPTGLINGINVTFTLANSPSPALSLQLFLNGVLQIQGVDYTLAAGTITFTTAPDNGSGTTTLRAWYRF